MEIFNMMDYIKKLDRVSTIFLTVTPIATVICTWLYFKNETFNPWFIAVFLFFYFATGMSITGGYHRLFAHKSYDANPFVRFMYIFFGAGAFQNSVKKWATDHRIHHRYVDQDKDPYCIKKGFWYAHFLWMCEKSEHRDTQFTKNFGRDFEKDKLIMWQDKHYVWIATISGFGVPTLIGAAMGSPLGGLVFGGLLRMVIVHHFTFFINSACHFWGRQPYTDTNTAKDNAVLALFTYGEGYHNFHHIFHNDYRNGIRWYHFDPTKWFIKTMAYVNCVKNLKTTPEFEIFKAKMTMMEKKALAKSTAAQTLIDNVVSNLKVRADEAHNRWNQLKNDYEVLKIEFQNSDKLQQLQNELKAAKYDFQVACYQWKQCLQAV
jgi:stearoyl-CoA desaturase (Delta-9 desaturase)